MNITRNIINDLFPLYAANECSADTRALVEDYLRQHPQDAAELRRILNSPLPGPVPPARNLAEMDSLRKARRVVQLRSWVLGFAIFFSLAPFSFIHTGGHTYVLLREAPVAGAIYGGVGIVLWISYFVLRSRAQVL